MNNRDMTGIIVAVVFLLALVFAAFFVFKVTTTRGEDLVRCTGNLKAIFGGFCQYARHYDNYYPPADAGYAGFTDSSGKFHKAGDGWFGVLCNNYLDGETTYIDGKAFRCPADPRGFQKDNISYGYNVYFAGRPDTPISVPALGGQIWRRGHTIMVADAKVYLIRPPYEKNWPGRAPELRHSGKTNCIMADGHVEQLDLNELDLSGPDNWWTLKKLEE